MKLEGMPRKVTRVPRGALYHADPYVAALEQVLDEFRELQGALFTFLLELDVASSARDASLRSASRHALTDSQSHAPPSSWR
jgi:hypothetical protein